MNHRNRAGRMNPTPSKAVHFADPSNTSPFVPDEFPPLGDSADVSSTRFTLNFTDEHACFAQILQQRYSLPSYVIADSMIIHWPGMIQVYDEKWYEAVGAHAVKGLEGRIGLLDSTLAPDYTPDVDKYEWGPRIEELLYLDRMKEADWKAMEKKVPKHEFERRRRAVEKKKKETTSKEENRGSRVEVVNSKSGGHGYSGSSFGARASTTSTGGYRGDENTLGVKSGDPRSGTSITQKGKDRDWDIEANVGQKW